MKESDLHPTNWHFYNENGQQPVTFKLGVRTYTGTLVGEEAPILNYFGNDVPPKELFYLVQMEDGNIVTVNINSFCG